MTDKQPPDDHRDEVLARIDEIRAELEREDLTNGEEYLLLVELAVLSGKSIRDAAQVPPAAAVVGQAVSANAPRRRPPHRR